MSRARRVPLLTATNRYYLGLSTALFLLSGVLFYVGLQRALRHEMDEQLQLQQAALRRWVQRTGVLPAVPFNQQLTVQAFPAAPPGFSDTLLLDALEGAMVPHRQLTFRLNGQWLTLRKSLLETEDILQLVLSVLGVMMGMLLLGLLGLNHWLSGRLWAPFRHSLHRLRHYDLAEHRPLSLPQPHIREFAELNQALNQMSARLEADYRNLKEFTENAAHETRTPLAIMQARLEQLMQLPVLTEAPTAAPLLHDLYEAVLRLSRLHQALTLLSKIENRQFPAAAPVRLDQLLHEKLGLLHDFIEAKHLRLHLALEGIPILRLHPALADSLLSNLLQNAIKHNMPGGELRVLLTDNTLEINNTGPQLPAGNPEQFFTRFRKLHGSSASPGLGLAIVQQICQSYEFELRYTYAEVSGEFWHRLRVAFREEETNR